MTQIIQRVPLYDHPDRFESLGRRRRLSRQGIDPDQHVHVTMPIIVEHTEAVKQLESEMVS